MTNTNLNTRVSNTAPRVIQYLTIDSDGSEETALIVYDSGVVATALGLTDTANSKILRIRGVVAAAATARIELQWDATTDIIAFCLPINEPFDFDFREMNGLPNPAGTGKTGDILLTTAGLANLDNITLILEVKVVPA